MNNKQKEEFNLQIRKVLKQFGIKAHRLVEKRFESDISDCDVSIKLEIDSKQTEESKTIIKISQIIINSVDKVQVLKLIPITIFY